MDTNSYPHFSSLRFKMLLMLMAVAPVRYSAAVMATGSATPAGLPPTPPFCYTENAGQITDDRGNRLPDVLLKATFDGLDIYITNTGITYVPYQLRPVPGGQEDFAAPGTPNIKNARLSRARIDVLLKGAAISRKQVEYSGPSLFYSNYYTPACKKGLTGVRNYSSFTIKNIYPGIDWHWYVTADNRPVYDFIVHPGADPGVIKMQYKWADLKPDNDAKSLVVSTPLCRMIEGEVKSFCKNAPVDTRYIVDEKGKTIRFKIAAYDHSQVLQIDPPLALLWSLLYNTYFLSGFRGDAVDIDGNILVTGYTSDPHFPVLNPGGGAYFQDTIGSSSYTDAAIMKYSNAGELLWSTYYGGSNLDYGDAVTTDKLGNAFICGETKSLDFPLMTGPAGSFNQAQTDSVYSDAFLLEFDINGVRKWATCYGTGGNAEGMSVATDANNNIYMTGYSSAALTLQSPGGGAYYQGTLAGSTNAFLVKFNASDKMIWGTYYGGSYYDYGLSVHVSADNKVYLAGYTSSPNFPLQTLAGAYNQGTYAGGSSDAFIVAFDTAGVRNWATFYGGNSDDYGTSVTTDLANNLLITGRTGSTNFPVLASTDTCAYYQAANAGGYDIFISKFTASGTQEWSTYFGGSGTDGGNSITTDGHANIFITGYTNSTDFPLYNPGPPAYFNDTISVPFSAFMMGFKDSDCLIWSTYAPPGFEYGNSVVTDLNGTVYLAAEGTIYNDTTYGGGGGGGGGWYSVGANAGGAVAAFGGFGGGGGTEGGGGGGGGGGDYSPCFYVSSTLEHTPCMGQCNGEATLNIFDGEAPFSFQWSGGQSTQSASGLCAGTYIATVTDNYGCVEYAYVDVLPLTDAVLNYQDERCADQSRDGFIETAANFGTPPYSYTWSNGQTTANITGLSMGLYGLTVSDSSGCSVTLSQYISGQVVNHAPGIVSCVSNGVKISADLTTLIAYPGYSYLWGNGDTTLQIVIDSTGNFEFSITDDSIGCSFDTTLYIQYPLLTANLLATMPRCYGMDSGSAQVLTTCNGCAPPVTYAWSNGSRDSVISNLQANNYSVTVSDTKGCSASADTLITQPSKLISDSLIRNPLCYGDSNGSVTIITQGGTYPSYSYRWSNNQHLTDSIANSLRAGSYTVTISDGNNCADTLDISLSQPALLQLETSVGSVTCYGKSNGYIAANVTGGTSPYNYQWSDNHFQNVDSVFALQPGVYTVLVTDSNGCKANGKDTIISPSSALVAGPVVMQSGLTCYNSNNAVLSITASGGSPAYTYTLKQGSTDTTQLSDIFMSVGAGTATIIVTDSFGCTVTADYTVDSFARATTTLTIDSATCYGQSNGEIKVLSQPVDRSPFSYSLNGGAFQYYNVFPNLPAGAYQLEVADKNNCTDTITAVVGQPDSIESPIWLNGRLLPIDSVMLNNQSYASFTKTNPLYWLVDFSPVLSTVASTDTLVQIQPQESLGYTVTIYADTSNKNCFVSYKGEIVITTLPDFPNLITPNNDGINDRWEIDLAKYPNAEVTIFDRWGETVFASTNYNNDWDGTNQKTGRHVADGAYYYILSLPLQNNAVYRGNINVIDSTH